MSKHKYKRKVIAKKARLPCPIVKERFEEVKKNIGSTLTWISDKENLNLRMNTNLTNL